MNNRGDELEPPDYLDFAFIEGLHGVVPVDIDIKPGSFPNSINTKSMGKVPVAILGTEDFDVMTVDPYTVLFGPDGAAAVIDPDDPGFFTVGDGHIEDVNGVLKIVRINVVYHLTLPADQRADAQDAFNHYITLCPAAQSVIPAGTTDSPNRPEASQVMPTAAPSRISRGFEIR